MVITVSISTGDGTQHTSTAVLPAATPASTLVRTALGALSGALAQIGLPTTFSDRR